MKKTLGRLTRFRICLEAWESWFHPCILCGKIILPFQSKFKHFGYANGKHGYSHWKCDCEQMCEKKPQGELKK